jgi:hypothetical protein
LVRVLVLVQVKVLELVQQLVQVLVLAQRQALERVQQQGLGQGQHLHRPQQQ